MSSGLCEVMSMIHFTLLQWAALMGGTGVMLDEVSKQEEDQNVVIKEEEENVKIKQEVEEQSSTEVQEKVGSFS